MNSSLLDTKNSAPNKLIHDDLKRGLYVESAFNIYIYIYIYILISDFKPKWVAKSRHGKTSGSDQSGCGSF